MATSLVNLSTYDENTIKDISKYSFGIVVADWNKEITHKLFEGCYDTLLLHHADKDKIHVYQVPGSFELPSGSKLLMNKFKVDVVICLGCVIKGDTSHDDYINNAVAQGLTQLSILSGKPQIFGLVTTNNLQQAIDRSGGVHGNKGVEAAYTAIRMAQLKEDATFTKNTIGF
ncbi:MAG: 6,7-dimethyl-8-ribityllumazine synthase [Saprospiraceae bacterium]|nr:6,7-dimethyl-8-ribityllumazine synthase [Saprospiraceae bacterium]